MAPMPARCRPKAIGYLWDGAVTVTVVVVGVEVGVGVLNPRIRLGLYLDLPLGAVHMNHQPRQSRGQ